MRAGIDPDVPEIAVAVDARLPADHTYREIVYEEHAGVGYLHFDFYNGAMSTDQCQRLRDAYALRPLATADERDRAARRHRLLLKRHPSERDRGRRGPGGESWRNLNAINDLVKDIIETDSHLVISALRGDAAAGGVPLALAADYVVAREDIVLNPYYQHMGGLYGSEYWTYLLPRRVGVEMTARLISAPFTPLGTQQAIRIGLLDDAFGDSLESFQRHTRSLAERIARDPSSRIGSRKSSADERMTRPSSLCAHTATRS